MLHPILANQIASDLAPWPSISREQVLGAKELGCHLHIAIKNGQVHVVTESISWESRTACTLEQVKKAAAQHRLEDSEFVIWCSDKRESDSAGRFPALVNAKQSPSSLILIPDFSFGGWPEVGVEDWATSLRIIGERSPTIPWEKRTPVLFFRGAMTSELRVKIALISRENPDLIDVGITVWDRTDPTNLKVSPNGVPLYDHAAYRYLCSIPGHSYANRIKWLMATGSAVVHVDNGWQEFWYGLLKHCENCFIVSEGGIAGLPDLVRLLKSKDTSVAALGENGRRTMYEDLSPERVTEYWALLLNEYAKRISFEVSV